MAGFCLGLSSKVSVMYMENLKGFREVAIQLANLINNFTLHDCFIRVYLGCICFKKSV